MKIQKDQKKQAFKAEMWPYCITASKERPLT